MPETNFHKQDESTFYEYLKDYQRDDSTLLAHFFDRGSIQELCYWIHDGMVNIMFFGELSSGYPIAFDILNVPKELQLDSNYNLVENWYQKLFDWLEKNNSAKLVGFINTSIPKPDFTFGIIGVTGFVKFSDMK